MLTMDTARLMFHVTAPAASECAIVVRHCPARGFTATGRIAEAWTKKHSLKRYAVFRACGKLLQRVIESQTLEPEKTPGRWLQIGTRRAYAARVTVHWSVCLSVCRHLFSHYPQQGGPKAIPTGSVPRWLHF